jgi:hypothetical protein
MWLLLNVDDGLFEKWRFGPFLHKLTSGTSSFAGVWDPSIHLGYSRETSKDSRYYWLVSL